MGARQGEKSCGGKALIHVASSRSGLYQGVVLAGAAGRPSGVAAASASVLEAFRGSAMASNNGAIKLVSGNSNPTLAEGIGAYLGTPLTKAVVRRFADMEIFVEIQENVRGADVFVIQSTSFPANDHLMELLIIMDALRHA
jgi:hypothetical protein